MIIRTENQEKIIAGMKEAISFAKSRNNSQMWKLAEWFNDHIGQFYDQPLPFKDLSQDTKDQLYDKAKELTYMYIYNAFTGPDYQKD